MLTIILGLLGLSFVVVIHEFGHFLAARAVGVDVEVFSIGMGPRLAGFKRRGTDWRISAFPLGGFCRMKGEEAFKEALEKKLTHIPAEKGTFYGVAPWRRMVILIAGPLANVILAIVLFIAVSLVGVTVQTAPNRIILASDVAVFSGAAADNPANAAGLKSGDVVVSIDGAPVLDYSDLQEAIGFNPGKRLTIAVRRGDETIALPITPRLDKSSGQGLIGIYAWIDPVVSRVDPQSAAGIAGIKPGDRITAVDGIPVDNSIGIAAALAGKPERATLTVLRSDSLIEEPLVLTYDANGQPNVGLDFVSVSHTEKASSFADAVSKGAAETWSTLALSVKGIGLLFSGVNVLKAVSGPARITYMVGNTAKESIKASGFGGIPTILSFLAFLSVSLFLMNLLPIPALDGGQLLLSVVEAAKRKPLHTKTIYRFQFVGTAMILALFFLAAFSDLLFFAGK
jgi:regulator of sigma E protease